MQVPAWMLRKLYRRGSLRQTADGWFAFSLQNPLVTATIVAPPEIVVNGMAVPNDKIASRVEISALSRDAPLVFRKGEQLELKMPGQLLLGGNRIHIWAETEEFGPIEIYVEDKEAEFCDLPGARRAID